MPRTPRPRKKQDDGTPEPAEWIPDFLAALGDSGGQIRPACLTAKVGKTTVYDEIARNPALALAVEEAREVSVERAESTLFQQALGSSNPAFLIFYLKNAKPDVYADKLNPHQIEQIKQDARREVLGELQSAIGELTPQARRLVLQALSKATTQELPQ